ncbi:unnamed protein product [Phaeothamnion confervicola]
MQQGKTAERERDQGRNKSYNNENMTTEEGGSGEQRGARHNFASNVSPQLWAQNTAGGAFAGASYGSFGALGGFGFQPNFVPFTLAGNGGIYSLGTGANINFYPGALIGGGGVGGGVMGYSLPTVPTNLGPGSTFSPALGRNVMLPNTTAGRIQKSTSAGATGAAPATVVAAAPILIMEGIARPLDQMQQDMDTATATVPALAMQQQEGATATPAPATPIPTLIGDGGAAAGWAPVQSQAEMQMHATLVPQSEPTTPAAVAGMAVAGASSADHGAAFRSGGRAKNGKGRSVPVEDRRSVRNMREQKRSLRINRQIDELRDVLLEAGVTVKPNKYAILATVVDHMLALQSRSKELDGEGGREGRGEQG